MYKRKIYNIYNSENIFIFPIYKNILEYTTSNIYTTYNINIYYT